MLPLIFIKLILQVGNGIQSLILEHETFFDQRFEFSKTFALFIPPVPVLDFAGPGLVLPGLGLCLRRAGWLRLAPRAPGIEGQ